MKMNSTRIASASIKALIFTFYIVWCAIPARAWDDDHGTWIDDQHDPITDGGYMNYGL